MIQTLTNEFHSKPAEEVLKQLSSGMEGLSPEKASTRLRDLGPNEIVEKQAGHPVLIFLKQLHSSLIYILIAAAAISFFIGHAVDAYVILAVILINAVIGFIQENKAEKSIQNVE